MLPVSSVALVPATDKTPSLRSEHAALTRTRVLDAAQGLFVVHGWTGTTVEAIARTAGVSVQTVYNVAGGKPALLKAVYDRVLAGDDDPRTLAEREQITRMRALTDPGQFLDAYARLGRQVSERTAPLLAVVLAQATDSAVRSWVDVIDAERAEGTRRVAEHAAAAGWLRPGVDIAEAADVLWSLTAPELAVRLGVQRGWGWERYGRWLATTMRAALLP